MGGKNDVLPEKVNTGIKFGRAMGGNIRHSQEPEECRKEDSPKEKGIRKDITRHGKMV